VSDVTPADSAACAAWLQQHLGAYLFTVDHPALPACAGAHRPGQPCDGTRGKHPCGRWTRDSAASPDLIRAALARGPRNLGIDCGKSGLLVIDEDTPGAFTRYARSLGQMLPVTFTVTTGKGRHLYFCQPPGPPLGNRTGALSGRGIDVRGHGGYAVAPGSVHHTGAIYTPAEPATPPAPAPAWLITALRSPPPARPRPSPHAHGSPHARLRGAVSVVLAAQPGERNNRLHWAACRAAEMITSGHLDPAAAIAALTTAAQTTGLRPGEIQATIASALKNAAT
jgi:Bifunctional DNA primase/polymerase, N-terminal